MWEAMEEARVEGEREWWARKAQSGGESEKSPAYLAAVLEFLVSHSLFHSKILGGSCLLMLFVCCSRNCSGT